MLRQRVVTAVIAVLVLLLVLYAAPPALARVVIVALFAVAAWEWSGFLSGAEPPKRYAYVGLMGAALLALWYWLPDASAYRVLALTAALWWAAALIWLFFFPTSIAAPIVWLCGALVVLPAYAALDWLYVTSAHYLLGLLVIVWSADIGAYFAGRTFGRVKLAPAVSPGKTWEGVAGGLAAVLAVTASAAALLELPMARLLPFAAAVALLSVVGDLTVSMFKRHAGVKDSGSVFPGHGGILDRIDSVCAAAPMFAVGVATLGIDP